MLRLVSTRIGSLEVLVTRCSERFSGLMKNSINPKNASTRSNPSVAVSPPGNSTPSRMYIQTMNATMAATKSPAIAKWSPLVIGNNGTISKKVRVSSAAKSFSWIMMRGLPVSADGNSPHRRGPARPQGGVSITEGASEKVGYWRPVVGSG